MSAHRLVQLVVPRVLGRYSGVLVALVLLTLSAQRGSGAPGPVSVPPVSDLDTGFKRLYQLKATESRERFVAWQVSHPEDPLGSAAEAASLLFEECFRQGVLTSEYFLDDDRFLGRVAMTPDVDLRDAFRAAEVRAQALARRQLEADPANANALFAMTLSLGMEADYAALIEKHQLQSLGMSRQADIYATRLLSIRPDASDAYLTLGIANYVVGSLPTLMRFALRLKGISGNKTLGIKQLEIAATSGHYMRPFAKIMLALAALREKHVALARIQLQELVDEFPENPIFVSELAKLGPAPRARNTRP